MKSTKEGLASTGIHGLDQILGGGLTRHRLYLVEGSPGSGKTTLALQFLRAGAALGERVLYISLSETEEELRAVAGSHGWDMEGITVRELIPSEDSLKPDEQYTLFHPSEVELAETTRAILTDAENFKPSRVVFDSLAELRLLAGHPLRYRRQILALKQFFLSRKCTVLMLDDRASVEQDVQLQTLSHGVVTLEHTHPAFGAERRRLCVMKYRGMPFRGGFHDFKILTGGLRVFPRLIAAEHRHSPRRTLIPSGVGELDALLGGGVECGTSTLIAGAAGSGKSTLATQFVASAARDGQRAAMFIFDESVSTLLSRAAGLGIPLREAHESKRALIQPIDPAEMSPGQFAHAVVDAVTVHKASVIVIDSLNGYMQSMPEERFLTAQLHELLAYLGHQGVATILIGVHQGLIGAAMQTPVDASYLADGVILLRYFEARGEVRQAISVMKRRGGTHERTIRELQLDAEHGIRVGAPLREFRGILTGVPQYDGQNDPLLRPPR
jgi:circadian clock protein KaiC